MASGALATLASACGVGMSSPTAPSGVSSVLSVLPGRFTGSVVQVSATGSPLAEVGGAALVESTAGVFLIAVGFVLINALVDLAYAALDPRIRYS